MEILKECLCELKLPSSWEAAVFSKLTKCDPGKNWEDDNWWGLQASTGQQWNKHAFNGWAEENSYFNSHSIKLPQTPKHLQQWKAAKAPFLKCNQLHNCFLKNNLKSMIKSMSLECIISQAKFLDGRKIGLIILLQQ